MPKDILAWGYTTGTCAQAATKAAISLLLGSEKATRTRKIQKPDSEKAVRTQKIQKYDSEKAVRLRKAQNQAEQVAVRLPNGKTLILDIHDVQIKYADDCPVSVSCAVQKDSGDDPDITNGVYVYSKVERTSTGKIVLEGGKGVGRVTKPGLEQPVGSAAINRVPRQMIIEEVKKACEETGYQEGIHVEISIPEGEKLAEKTFNPRLGITGGLSILGTSGMVEPMSEQALIDTIRLEIQVKLAEHVDYLLVTPGNYGLDFLKDTYGIGSQDVVKCSNYIGQTLDMAVELGCKGILLAGHIGKLIKVAGGIMNTHSKWADCRMELLAAAALRSGMPGVRVCELLECVTTDDALGKCSRSEREAVMRQVMERIETCLNYRVGKEMLVGAITFSNVYGILGMTGKAEELLRKYKENDQMRIDQ